jgi:peptidyl-prolyl cis-trans isomerase C
MKYLTKALTAAALATTMASAATVVTVNGNAITDQEVNSVLMEGTQGRFNQLPPEKQDELRKRIVDGMITQQLIYEDAKKNRCSQNQNLPRRV